jgi:hypothetical protein
VDAAHTELKAALENAEYATLTCCACTDQAHRLTDHVMALLPEAPQGRRLADPILPARYEPSSAIDVRRRQGWRGCPGRTGMAGRG